MKLRAPAKLNLRLRVFGCGEDGYHSIETLFLKLGLADEITIDHNDGGLRLETSGNEAVPDGEDNLCWQAAQVFFESIGCSPAASIQLVKYIPVAAGLGGGSSDAATVLLGLNRIYEHPIDKVQLMGLAGSLGSDVPFFVSEARFALGWERGRRLLPLEPPTSRAVLLVVPDFGVSAGEAYAWLREDVAGSYVSDRAGAGQLPASADLADWEVLTGQVRNDLAEPVYRRHPELRAAADALISCGVEITLLCGSGACVAGVFETTARRDAVAEELRMDPVIPDAWRLVSTWSDGPGSAELAG